VPLALDTPAVVYHAASIDTINPAVLTARFRADTPPSFAVRVRQLAAEVDPALQVRRATSLSAHYGELRAFWRYISWAVGLLTLSVLLLSAAGMYALMSCTVAQRTREIGIRVALGAGSRRLLVGIFARVLRHIAIGVASGSLVSGALMLALDIDGALAAALIAAVATMMLIVGLVAAWGPARRSLRIQAAEALRADA
jgi:ABC-type lipoprotein release transport system permease subunit